MTDIAFQTISNAIKTELDEAFANRTPLPEVVLEQEFEPKESWIGVYCQGATAPEGDQPLTASLKQRLRIRYEIWCWRFAMSNALAVQLRDELLGDLELALMRDRTFGGTVTASWLEGGRFGKQDDPQQLGRFFSGAEVVLICDVMASNI